MKTGFLESHVEACVSETVENLHREFTKRETELVCRLLRDEDALRDMHARLGGSLEAVRRLLVRLTADSDVRDWLIEQLRRIVVRPVP